MRNDSGFSVLSVPWVLCGLFALTLFTAGGQAAAAAAVVADEDSELSIGVWQYTVLRVLHGRLTACAGTGRAGRRSLQRRTCATTT